MSKDKKQLDKTDELFSIYINLNDDKSDGFDEYEPSIITNVWWQLPEYNNYLISLRLNNKYNYAINTSVLINSAVIIEGFIYESIKDFVGENIWVNSIQDRLLKEFNSKLDKSSWSELNSHFKSVFNFELNTLTTPENWKAIVILFIFRNMIIHSKPMFYTVRVKNGKPNVQHFTNYDKIYKYLIEKKLSKEVNYQKSSQSEYYFDKEGPELIDSNIVDHFWNETKIFLKNIIENSQEINDLPSKESYTDAFSFDIAEL